MVQNSWVYNTSVKCSYYSLFLGVHIKGNQIFCITTQNGGSGGIFVRYRYHKFYRSRASCFRQFTMLSTIFSAICISTIFPAICIYINCTIFEIANLFFKTKKVTRHTKDTVEDTALFTSSTFAEQFYHIIQFLRSPEIDRCFPGYLNDKHARQNFKRKAERYKWDETRQKLFYPKHDQFKNSK